MGLSASSAILDHIEDRSCGERDDYNDGNYSNLPIAAGWWLGFRRWEKTLVTFPGLPGFSLSTLRQSLGFSCRDDG